MNSLLKLIIYHSKLEKVTPQLEKHIFVREASYIIHETTLYPYLVVLLKAVSADGLLPAMYVNIAIIIIIMTDNVTHC